MSMVCQRHRPNVLKVIKGILHGSPGYLELLLVIGDGRNTVPHILGEQVQGQLADGNTFFLI